MKEFEKITEKEIKTAGVQALHDRPNAYSRYGSGGMTAQELKEAFDKLAMLIAGRYNEIQRALADGSFSQYVGMSSDLNTRLGVSLKDFLLAFKTGAISERMMVDSVVGTKSLSETIMALYRLDVNEIILTEDTDGGVCISLKSRSGEMDSVKLVVEKANLAKSVTDFIDESIKNYGAETVVPMVENSTYDAKNYANELDEATNKRVDEANIHADALNTETNKRVDEANIHADALNTETNKRVDALNTETNKRVDAVEKETVKSISYDAKTGVLSFAPMKGDAKHIDLPLELTVESGYYDADANELVIVLTSGDECRIPVDDLIREVISMPTAAAEDAGKVAVASGENKYELRIPTCEFATEGLTYKYADGSFSVVGLEQSVGGKVIIPAQIGEIPVRKIRSLERNANVTEIEVPDSVESISDYAFYNNTGLEKVVLSRKLSSIPLGLFYLCSNLKDVYIRYDEGVASLAGTVAFGGCTATIHVPKQFLDAYKGATNWAKIADNIIGYETLESLRKDLGAEVQARLDHIAANNEAMELNIQAVQKQTVEVVENEQNERARNDKEIRADISDIKGSNAPTPSEGLEFDGYGAVIGIGTCTDTELIIPSEHNGYSIVALGNGSVPGGDYSRIKKIVVPDSVSNIYNFIFSFANNVEIIEIGNGIERMNMTCFSGASLTKIIMHAETPPDVNAGMPPISGTISPECVLCVPENAIDAYKAHDEFWGKFVTEYGGIEPIVEEKAPSLWGLQGQIDEINKNGAGGSGKNYDKEIADLQSQIDAEKSARETEDSNLKSQNDSTLTFAQQVQQLVVNVHADLQNQINAINATLRGFTNVAEVAM